MYPIKNNTTNKKKLGLFCEYMEYFFFVLFEYQC